MNGNFGFSVTHYPVGDWDGDASPEGWRVSLPHQCERWEIAGEKWEQPPSHEQAIADLERFIAEATEALTALRAKREINEVFE